jgi:hypothetical protein
MKDLLFTLYNNLIFAELIIFAVLLLVWVAVVIMKVIKKHFGARLLV